jgi:N-hydroxyarylamine O-acetyltransferase
MPSIDCAAYLRRIRCHRLTGTAVAALRKLHRRHLMSVPFENLDVLRGRPLGTTGEAVLDKVVTRLRGGLCFELNRAFDWLLAELGFRVTLVGAEVAHDDVFFEGIDHPVLLVAAGSEMWLADVGFGAISFVEPLRLSSTAPQPQFGVEYRINVEGGYHVVRSRVGCGEWQNLFRLTPSPRSWADFDDVRTFHQTSPESPFTRMLICYKATRSGQVMLTERRLTLLRHGQVSEVELDPDGSAYGAALAWILHGYGEPTPSVAAPFCDSPPVRPWTSSAVGG